MIKILNILILILFISCGVPKVNKGGASGGGAGGGGGDSDGTMDLLPDVAYISAGNSATVDVLANDNIDNKNSSGLCVVEVSFHVNEVSVTITPQCKLLVTPADGVLGDIEITYTVRNNNGKSKNSTLTVTVVSTAPIAGDDSVEVNQGSNILIDVKANDSDADGDPITIQSVGNPNHGVAAIENQKIRYTPTAIYHGTDTFTYTIADNHGNSRTGTVTVTVVNNPPGANDDSANVSMNSYVDIDVKANDSDPDGDSFSVTALKSPLHGTATINGNNTIRYTPTNGYIGSDSFTYTITDENNNTDAATVSITVLNNPPNAVDDTSSVSRNGSVDIDVKANDSDPDNDILTVISVGSASHGVASINQNNTIHYVPSQDYAGTDSFTYTLSDVSGNTDIATVTVSVANIIASCTDLQNISNNLSGYYVLTQNIDCSATSSWNGGIGFEPIGSSNGSRFEGTIDGSGYTIDALYMHRDWGQWPNSNQLALVRYLGVNGVIKNVHLTNINSHGVDHIATMVVWNYGTVQDSSSQGTIPGTSGGGTHGGFAIWNYSTGVIKRSWANVTITGNHTAGFIGGSEGLIENCYALGSSVGSMGQVAGFLMNNVSPGIVRYSYAAGTPAVSWAWDGKGAGFAVSNTGTIEYSFSTGNPSHPLGVGGFVYDNTGGTISNVAWLDSTNGAISCVATGNSPTNCSTITDISYFKGAQVMGNAPMSFWNFNTTWQTVVGGYPTLR